MKRSMVLFVFLVGVLLSITVFSVAEPVVEKVKKSKKITKYITVEHDEECKTKTITEVKERFGNCNHFHNYTLCRNQTGLNTECKEKTEKRKFTCKIREDIITKEKTVCTPDKKLKIKRNTTDASGKRMKDLNLDFSDFGPCKTEEVDGCLEITCVSWHDGAHNGEFVECRPGMSCQKVHVCDDKVKKMVRNSQEEFSEEDPTFQWKKLELAEVEE